jgi:quercetin dioxygenase-like cupin family protein
MASNEELRVLLEPPFSAAWQQHTPAEPAAAALRSRLMSRAAATRAAETGMVTRRRRLVPRQALAAGAAAQTLYEPEPGSTLRPGEPHRVRLLELAPGATLLPQQWSPADSQARQRELLVLAGSVEVDGQVLSLRDYQLLPAGAPAPTLQAAGGALIFVRESGADEGHGAAVLTVRDAEAGWPDFAPGIQRRVLSRQQGQASMLYLAQPGAQVPQHRHGHDEECLMVQGELFLDDLLLQPGDYQLAQAGSGHRITETDTGVVIFAHGDLDLQFVD